MSLLAVVESLDQVDEKFHELYEQKGENEFVLKVEGLVQQEESKGWKAKEKSLMDQLSASKKNSEELKKALQDFQRKAEEDKEKLAAASGDYEQMYRSTDKNLKETQKLYSDLLKSIESEKEKSLIDNAINPICAKLFPDHYKMVLKDLRDRVKIMNVSLEDGENSKNEKSVGFLRDDGTIITSPADFENYLKEHSDYKKLITASFASGSGAKGSVGKPKTQANNFNDLPVGRQAMANLNAWVATMNK